MDSMNAEQQKGDEHHGDSETGGTRFTAHGPQQTFTAFDQQRALTVNLMEQVCDPKNTMACASASFARTGGFAPIRVSQAWTG